MKLMARLVVLILFSLMAIEGANAQSQPNPKKAATPEKAKTETLELGRSYDSLRP